MFFVCSLIVPVSTFTARKFSMWDFFWFDFGSGDFGGFHFKSEGFWGGF